VLWVRSDGITRVAAPRGVLAAAPLADGGLARAFQDGVIEVVQGGAVARRLLGPTDPVALSADAAGRRLAVVARGDHQAVFDLTDGRAWRLPIDPPPRAAALSPDGSWLAVSDREAPTVTVWDVDAGVPVRTLDGHDQTVAAVAWSPDGGWLATASGDRTARVWDAADGRVVAVLRGHTRHVSDVAFVGSELWTAGGDGDVRAWDLASLHQDPAAAMAAATSTGSCLYRGAVGPCGSP
jgi:WD40 repeat protein